MEDSLKLCVFIAVNVWEGTFLLSLICLLYIFSASSLVWLMEV